jgi:hypothetical protein
VVGSLPGLREERDRPVKPGDDIPTLHECQRIPPGATPSVQNPRSRGNPALGEEGGDTRAVVGDRARDEQIIGPCIGAVKWSLCGVFYAGNSPPHKPTLLPNAPAQGRGPKTRPFMFLQNRKRGRVPLKRVG